MSATYDEGAPGGGQEHPARLARTLEDQQNVTFFERGNTAAYVVADKDAMVELSDWR